MLAAWGSYTEREFITVLAETRLEDSTAAVALAGQCQQRSVTVWLRHVGSQARLDLGGLRDWKRDGPSRRSAPAGSTL